MVGVMVSGAYGHRVHKSLGFALVEQQHAGLGTQLEVEIIGHRHATTVIPEPAFDPGNQRPRS